MATNCAEYQFSRIEPHWQEYWLKEKVFRTRDDKKLPKYYVLDMFPYPSGAGLHIGHPEGYTGSDILARYQRACGKNVLHPMGWDAFGLPTEQYAIQTGTRPEDTSQRNITNFRRQIQSLGFYIDWDREIDTTDPAYYRWTQWIFLQLFQRGLAYVDERPVWWCEALGTVLANEEVIDGRSERGNHPVVRRNLRQWVLRITAYAERLLEGLAGLNWPDSTKRMQEAWIGRSEGAEIEFHLEGHPGSSLRVFTTRPDTLFGVTYMVVAPEHPLLDQITSPAQKETVAAYRQTAQAKSDLERTDLAKDKSGIFTGAFALHPLTGQRLPVWVADYVLISYGTGAIMAVPAHDERDYEFATRFQIPVQRVIEPVAGEGNGHRDTLPWTGEGVMVASDGFTGLPSAEGRRQVTTALEEKGLGRASIQYKLRDWLFSRQRYWGEPFPIVWISAEDYSRIAGTPWGHAHLPTEPVSYRSEGVDWYALPLDPSSLPLTLPEVESYQPSGNGESPLARAGAWLEVWIDFTTGRTLPSSQPRPEGHTWVRGRRETNTMPQWAGSCWYYLRYLDPLNNEAFASPESLQYWQTPDIYIGGAEHAVLHLLYARFWHMVLFDAGLVPEKEPFRRLFHQGIILGEDGAKMSKSLGNVVNPDSIIRDYGADTLRLYLMFLGPLEAMKPWNPKGIEGVHRFLRRVWRECVGETGAINPKLHLSAQADNETLRIHHETIRKVTQDIENLRFNTAISQLMVCLNHVQKLSEWPLPMALQYVQLLAPFAPHIAEELWARLGGATGSVVEAPWPHYEEKYLAREEVVLVVQVNGKVRANLLVAPGLPEEEAVSRARQEEKVQAFLDGKTIRKVVYVPGRILNLVAG